MESPLSKTAQLISSVGTGPTSLQAIHEYDMNYAEHAVLIKQCLLPLKERYRFYAIQIHPDVIICENELVAIEIYAERYDTIGQIEIIDKQGEPPTRYQYSYVCHIIGVDYSRYEIPKRPISRPEDLSQELTRIVTIFLDNLTDMISGDFRRLNSNNQYNEYVNACKTIGRKVVMLPHGNPILLKMQQGDKTWIDDYKRLVADQ